MKYIAQLLFLAFVWSCSAPSGKKEEPSKPKLIVGIVVDQMRNEYLQRYADLYGSDGFKRMMNEGFYAANHHFSYVPTYTGPGHASIYTGTTPSVHGIASNNWYDPRTGEMIYCAQDKSVRTIGIDNADGQMSPKNLQVTTITDELRLVNNMRSKSIGISLKDRGAILPAGRSGTAYWYSKGRFITSTWYMDTLPQWVAAFNDLKLRDEYTSRGWDLLLPAANYNASLPEGNAWQKTFPGEGIPAFPKNLVDMAEQNGPDHTIKNTPYGNTLVLEFAKEAIKSESLGKDDYIDFLAISFSTPDYMGHAYGPRAVEIQDMYLRLDQELGAFFKFLDQEVGRGNYSVFLTADHGGAEVPGYAMSEKLPAGYLDMKALSTGLEQIMLEIHPSGKELIEKVHETGLFFNRAKLKAAKLHLTDVSASIARGVRNMEGIYNAWPGESLLLQAPSVEFPIMQIQRGLYPPLCPDVVWVSASGWIEYGPVGTTHGSPWRYDTHIPLLMYGAGVSRGSTFRETNIRDIAPTFCMMHGIPLPSGNTGSPIIEAIATTP